MRLMLLLPIGAALLGASASVVAASFHAHGGAECIGESVVDRQFLVYNGYGVINEDTAGARIVHCPVTRGDADQPNSVFVTLYDRHPQQPTGCRVEVSSESGALFTSADTWACSSSNKNGCTGADPGLSDSSGFRYRILINASQMPTVGGGATNPMSIRCTVPPVFQNNRSAITGFFNGE